MRLGARLGIPQKVLAVYDRITEAIKSLIGKQDIIKQFYAQMETGKFRNQPQVSGRARVEDSVVYNLDPEQAKNTIAKFNSVKNGWRRKTIMSQITPELAQMYSDATGFKVSNNAKLVLTENAVRHMKNSGHLDGKGRYGMEDTNPITDADIADIPLVFREPDSIKVKGQKGYRGEKIELSKQLDNLHILAVELEQKSNGDFYIVSYYNKSRSPRQAQASGSQGLDVDFGEVPTSSRPKRPGEANDSIIQNTPQNVNNDLRFKHPLQDQIDDIQNNPKLKMTKELRQAIDEEIYNYYPELFVSEAADLQSTNGDWNIPRLHVDDLIAIEQKTVKRLQHLALKRAPSRRHYVGKFFMYRNTRTITVYLRHNIKPPRIIWMRVNNYARVTPELLAQLKQRNRAEDSFGNQNKTTRARLKNSYFHRI